MKSVWLAGAVCCAAGAACAQVITVTVPCSRDNTLYETATGSLSDGKGQYFFVGKTSQTEDNTRRGLIYFDLSTLPAGAQIVEASVRLNMSRSVAGFTDVTLHRALKNWGEGTSDAAANEGRGAPSTNNDATWLHTFFPGQFWTTPGGDFGPPVAGVLVGGLGPYVFATNASLVALVQDWANNPAGNFGFVVVGDESGGGTAKRFDSRENGTAVNRPSLTVKYVLCQADVNGDGTVDVNDFFEYLSRFSANDPRADIDGNGTVDVNDFFAYLSLYSVGC